MKHLPFILAALALAWLLKLLLWDGRRLYVLTRPGRDRGDGTRDEPLYAPLWGRAGSYAPDLNFQLGKSRTPLMTPL